MSVTPQQRIVAIELLGRIIDEPFEDAETIVELMVALREQGERGLAIMKWLSLLPRARGRAELAATNDALQLTLLTPTTNLPRTVQHAMRPVTGEDKTRSVAAMRDPDAHERVSHGSCVDCGELFPMTWGRRGRPPTRCERHRFKARSG